MTSYRRLLNVFPRHSTTSLLDTCKKKYLQASNRFVPAFISLNVRILHEKSSITLFHGSPLFNNI